MGGPDAPQEIADAIAGASARSPLPLDIRWHSSVTSTMDVVSEAVDSGAPEGLVVIADEQTAGRGRRGHSWSSPPGAGAYLSYLLRPPDTMRGRLLSLLTLAAGVAVRNGDCARDGPGAGSQVAERSAVRPAQAGRHPR